MRREGDVMRFLYGSVGIVMLVACGGGDGGKEAGTEGGPCFTNGTCNHGLTCLSDLCVNLAPPLDVIGGSDVPDNGLQKPDISGTDSLTDTLGDTNGGGDTSTDSSGPSDLPTTDLGSDSGAGDDNCTPQCVGKECGANGCGGLCGSCGDNEECGETGLCACALDSVACKDVCCGTGQVCFSETCCAPACVGKQCGDDNCGGSCGECGGATPYCEDGLCVPECAAESPVVDGWVKNNVKDMDFTGELVDVQLFHKLDIDEWEDGCISKYVLSMSKLGLGCEFSIQLETAMDGYFGVTEAVFIADSFCPGWSDSDEGEYQLKSSTLVVCSNVEVTAYMVESTCIPSVTVGFSGLMTLERSGDGKVLEVDLSDLQVVGDMISTGETELYCPDLCAGKCENDGCGGSWGDCKIGWLCGDDHHCYDPCVGQECGEDGYGGSCGTCTQHANSFCNASDQCDCTANICGDLSEECGGPYDDGCGGTLTCPDCADCGEECQSGNCVFTACDGKKCGEDGCGGICGKCTGGKVCQGGDCICLIDEHKACCGDAVCWFDSCGNQGSQVADCTYGCIDGSCKPCPLNCTGKSCGDDGCGGICGYCSFGDFCKEGQCALICVPNCLAEGSVCGDNGCGGSCGDCGDGFVCDEVAGFCAPYVCEPDCTGKECGATGGCGETNECGECVAGQSCTDLGQCVMGPCQGVHPEKGKCDGDFVLYCSQSGGEDELIKIDCTEEPGKICGWDPWGGKFACVDEPLCIPNCTDKECGDDGCGQSCGSCPVGWECPSFKCRPVEGASCSSIEEKGNCWYDNWLYYCTGPADTGQVVAEDCTQQSKICAYDAEYTHTFQCITPL